MSLLKGSISFLFLFFLTAHARAAEKWYSFEPAEVTLSGRVLYEDHFGPPNYGENPRTDSVETAIILVLYEPINVKGSSYDLLNSATVKNIQRLQMVVSWEKVGQAELSGKNVTVTGTLFTRHTGHHRTEVLVSVQSLRIIE